ncbi:hypothetical protein [Undibacterium sp.]|uniref:hypothetical protein n=1 Tax=Undibacterium sp. TaxID=1914977 RepID=UPI002C3C2B13|nr:hypothetical protein [Undibacterium sp.]HTD02747.1 hypothetical protein [Undibacterium sp.]
MTREDLLKIVPHHYHKGRPYFVRLAEIPEPWRTQFLDVLRGSAVPILSGEKDAAYVWDWLAWAEGRWNGDAGPLGLV